MRMAGLGAVSLVLTFGFAPKSRAQGTNSVIYPVLQTLPASQIGIDYVPATGQKVLRFTTIVANMGPGPLELVPVNNPTNNTTLAYQILLNRNLNGTWYPVSSNFVGTFYYSSYADAWYFTDFSLHELCAVAADGSIGAPVAPFVKKISCCISDDTELYPTLPNAGSQTFLDCSHSTPKGLSIGWADIYDWPLYGQSFDITDLADGDYWLVSIVDPDHLLKQGPGASAYATASVKVHIATDLPWVDDSLPASVLTNATGGDTWQWINSNPTPYSGSWCHQSAIASGQHAHTFYGASPTMTVLTNNNLICYVYLDPVHPPTEVMLQWNDSFSWNHRAYWGANSILLGTNATPSRFYAGPLPAAGQWVRLEVPASQVGLQGVNVSGVSYTLYNGRAAWDYTGVHVAPPNPPPVVSITAPAVDATVSGTFPVSAFPSDGNGPGITSVQFKLDGAILGSPQTAVPYTLEWDTTAVGNAAHTLTAVVTDANGKQATSLPVPVLVNNSSSGTSIWFDDWLPAGAIPAALGGDSWNWVKASPAPYSGQLAHQSAIAAGLHEHYFESATQTLKVNPGDTLFTYVYLDPSHLPSEVMLEWNDGASAEHRAYWGADSIIFGQDGTAGRFNMGALPPAGQWVKLAVPASSVNLSGITVEGMSFDLYGGRATFDYSGVQHASGPPSVTLNSPTNNSTFVAPANLTLIATASASGATVSQVQFFQGTNSLRVVIGSPYQTTVTNLGAGNYTFSAVVTDSNGGKATNSVNVVVNAPTPLMLSGGQFISPFAFQFSFSTDAGVRYAVDRTTDFSAWHSLQTNSATGPLTSFTDTNAGGNGNFYRVRRLPNP